jgi:hypothetical protein
LSAGIDPERGAHVSTGTTIGIRSGYFVTHRILFQYILLFYTEINVKYNVSNLLSRYSCVFNDTYITKTLILLRIINEM